jgi:hypothetical protein
MKALHPLRNPYLRSQTELPTLFLNQQYLTYSFAKQYVGYICCTTNVQPFVRAWCLWQSKAKKFNVTWPLRHYLERPEGKGIRKDDLTDLIFRYMHSFAHGFSVTALVSSNRKARECSSTLREHLILVLTLATSLKSNTTHVQPFTALLRMVYTILST